MTSKQESLDQEKIPLIVAITGHRDAVLTGDTRLCMESLFVFLSSKLPTTPVWVISGMAGGADQFATELALEWRDSGRHGDVKVIAALPLEEQEYKKDFSEEEAKQFDALAARIDAQFTLQPYSWPGVQMESITLADDPDARASQLYSRERNAQYANLGAYLVRHANIVVALWDGCYHDNSPGGTGDVVRFMLNGRMQWGEGVPPRPEFNPHSLLHGGELGMVAHIPVERAKNSCEDRAADRLCSTPPEGWTASCKLRFYHTSLQVDDVEGAPQHFLHDYQMAEQEQLLQQLESYNGDIEKRRNPSRLAALLNKQTFAERLRGAWLPLADDEAAPHSTRATVHLFRAADSLAMEYQAYVRRLLMLYMLLASLAFISYEFVGYFSGSHNMGGQISFVTFFLSSILVGLVYLYTRRREYKTRFHKYRALAEALRIQFYLLYISDKATVERTFSGTHQRQFPWIAHSMRACTLFDWSTDSAAQQQGWQQRLPQVQKSWVEDQIAYLSAKLYGAKVKGLKLSVKQMVTYTRFFSLLAFAVLLMLSGVYVTEELTTLEILTSNEFELVTLVIVFLLGASGSINEWSEINGYEEDINRFQDSLAAFNRTVVELEGSDAEAKRQAIIDLAQQALQENTQWYDTHSQLDIDIGP